MSQRIFRKKALEKLASPEQLDQLMAITTPRGWLILLGLGSLLAMVVVWSVFATIPTTVSGDGILIASQDNPGQLEAVLYMSVWDGMRLVPDMEVKIAPVSVIKEEYGMIRGRVASVKRDLSTPEDMARVLGNSVLATMYSSDGKLIEVRVTLNMDENTPTGYEWTSADGPDITLESSTICNGVVVIDEERPIEIVFSQ